VGRDVVVEGEMEGIWGVVGDAGFEELVLDHILVLFCPDKEEFVGMNEWKKERSLETGRSRR
jgi:hypothetical protein